MCKGNSIKLLGDFSAETLQALREGHDIQTAEREKKSSNQEYPAVI